MSNPAFWRRNSKTQMAQISQRRGAHSVSRPSFAASKGQHAESLTTVECLNIDIKESAPPLRHLHSIGEGDTPSESPVGNNGSGKASATSLKVDPSPRQDTTAARAPELDPQEGWYDAIEQAVRRDAELVEEWRGAMDVLLIFATLFGAIITAFLVENYHDLKGDDANTIAYLSIIATTLGASGIPPPFQVATEPSARTKRVNRLWFASLLITIGSAIFAMLAKQWVAEYSEGLSTESQRGASDGRIRREARVREFRFAGVRKWLVPQIIGALPILLHASLFLFGVGLIDFFWELDKPTSIIILVFIGLISFFYAVSVVLPAIISDCPYKTPLSHLLANSLRSLHAIYDPAFRRERKVNALEFSAIDVDPEHRKSISRAFTGGALAENEKKAVERNKFLLDEEFLVWIKHWTRSESVALWADGEIMDLRKVPKQLKHWSTIPRVEHVNGGHSMSNRTTPGGPAEGSDVANTSPKINHPYPPVATTQRFNDKPPSALPSQARPPQQRTESDLTLFQPQPDCEPEFVATIETDRLGSMLDGEL